MWFYLMIDLLLYESITHISLKVGEYDSAYTMLVWCHGLLFYDSIVSKDKKWHFDSLLNFLLIKVQKIQSIQTYLLQLCFFYFEI